MPQTDERDRSLVEHLARVVLGCKQHAQGRFHLPSKLEPFTLNIDSWADAGMVWEKARVMGVRVILAGDMDAWEAEVYPEGGWEGLVLHRDSGPRAICYAIGEATGWKEPHAH